MKSEYNLITEEIILNFFEGKCNARDAAMVQAWLKENPSKLKDYIGLEEWESFQSPHALSHEVSNKLWNNIHKDSPAPRYHYFRWMAVAASILLAVVLSWVIISKKQKTSSIHAEGVAGINKIFNNTPVRKTLTLSDGTTVELLPNSMLTYSGDFNSTKRDVLLNGEANFNVAKDVARPFCVYSNSILVTVLGTRFTVNGFAADDGTKVILHEGSVMVKIADSSFQDNKKEYYLTSGDVFVRKKVSRRPGIQAEPVVKAMGISNDSLTARILHLEKDKDDCYVFNNYPLDIVLDQLEIIYNTKIIYTSAELGNWTFIGKIDKKDSLYTILTSIALLNNFSLHKQDDSYIMAINP